MEPEDDKTQSFVPLTKDTAVSHYTIIDKIGSGGMGDVYLAWDTQLERTVALKFLRPDLCRDEHCRKRFKREAQAAAQLSHANIVTVHEVGEFHDRPYIVMQHVEGHSLRHVIKQGKLSLGEAIELATQVCEGLREAHELGVVHRDIKPSNILLDGRGNPRLVDFGLATVIGTDKLTKTGSTLGTVGYMSPEQAEGKEVDQRSDLFSLGVVLYEMITGRRPFDRDSDVATSKAITTETAEPLARYKADVPDELQQIVNRALDKNIDTRYQTASGMLADLKRLQQAGSQSRKRKLGLWAAALVVLVAVIGYFLIDKFQIPKSDSNGWQNSVAVLVFRNLSGDPERDIFCEGMTEEIIGRLGTIKELKVTSTQSVLQFRDTEHDLKSIGRKLGVNNVLEGNIQIVGDDIRVRAQLIRVEDDAHIWTERYERKLANVFDLQDEISRAIAGVLRTTLVGDKPSFAARRGTDNIEAYNAYVKGRYLWRKRTEEDILAAIESFENAIALDSNYAAAWSGLADAWRLLPEYGNVTEAVAYPRSDSAASRALELDGNLAEAHASMANIYRYRGEFEAAEREFLRAIELNPGYPWGHHWYSNMLGDDQGREDERKVQLQIAYELDPLSLPVLTTMAYHSLRVGDPKKAIEFCERAFEIGGKSYYIYEHLASAHLDVGDTAQALETVERLVRDLPDLWKSFSVRGEFLSKLRESEKALEAYLTAVRVAPERWEPHVYLANFLHMRLTRYKESEKYLRKAIELDSMQPEPHRSYGWLLYQMGRTSEADEQHRRTVELAPYSAEANRAYGWFLGLGGCDYERALEYLNKAVQLNPWSDRAYKSLSWIAALSGDFDRALWAVGKAIEVFPNDFSSYRRRSRILALAGMLDSAAVSYTECLAMEPHDERALRALGDIYTTRCKYEQADSVYALLATHPDSVVREWAWDDRLKTLRHQGRFREAIEQMEAVRREIEARTGYTIVSFWTLRRQIDLRLSILGDAQSALAQCDSASHVLDMLPAERTTDRATVEGFRAKAIAEIGDIQTARRMLESYIRRLDPSETAQLRIYNLFLAAVHRSAGEYGRACELIEQRLECRPDFSARMNAGVSYLGAGRVGEAVSMLEAALSTYEQSRFTFLDEAVLARYYLAQAYEAAGRKADAIKQYETFLDIWKNADEGLKPVEDAKTRLENLKQNI